MSTVGKVLVILIVVSLLGWLFLAALVADHHMNWSKRFAEVQKERDTEDASLPPLAAQIFELTKEAEVLQVGLDRFRRNFRVQLAMKQREESETKETLSRTEFQLKALEAQVIAAQKRLDLRTQEKLDLDKKILALQGTVQEQMAENTKLKDEFQGLQKAFLTTLAENKAYVEQINKRAAAAKPRVRLGSLVR